MEGNPYSNNVIQQNSVPSTLQHQRRLVTPNSNASCFSVVSSNCLSQQLHHSSHDAQMNELFRIQSMLEQTENQSQLSRHCSGGSGDQSMIFEPSNLMFQHPSIPSSVTTCSTYSMSNLRTEPLSHNVQSIQMFEMNHYGSQTHAETNSLLQCQSTSNASCSSRKNIIFCLLDNYSMIKIS